LPRFYVNVIRGTPLFLQIYIAFFGLPLLGINPNKYLLGILVLALNSSAYLAEIFRAGIQSISKGQFEAASSLGMNYWQSMQYVIIPQTVKRVLPTMTSEFILLYKDNRASVRGRRLRVDAVLEEPLGYQRQCHTVCRGRRLLPRGDHASYPLRALAGGASCDRRGRGGGIRDQAQKKKKGENWEPAVAGPESGMLASSTEHESR